MTISKFDNGNILSVSQKTLPALNKNNILPPIANTQNAIHLASNIIKPIDPNSPLNLKASPNNRKGNILYNSSEQKFTKFKN
jgi:hypothetical protein